MTMRLFLQAIVKFTLGGVLCGALLFVPAGTFSYPAAWRFLAVLLVPMFLAGLVMMWKNPALLAHRLQAKEARGAQKSVILGSSVMFLGGFVLSGLDFRFGWLPLPDWISWLGVVLFLGSYCLYGEVLRENTYLSRTIEVQENQTVVDTGLYGIVRHPMYAVTLVLFWSIPLILGSLIGLIPFLIYPMLLVQRIRDEELFLASALNGYTAYQQKVRYRLLPGIW